MTTRSGSCACGQLCVTAEGEPESVAICHCFACQRRTGSAFGVSAWFRRERVSLEGRTTRFARLADSGARVTYDFCPDCGATVRYENDDIAGEVAIPVGTFADPTFPEPQVSVYHESRSLPWVEIATQGALETRG